MKKRDFRRAFGDPDAAFVFTVKNTLRRLDEEEKKPVKRKMRVSAAIAVAACLIISTAAFAAYKEPERRLFRSTTVLWLWRLCLYFTSWIDGSERRVSYGYRKWRHLRVAQVQ